MRGSAVIAAIPFFAAALFFARLLLAGRRAACAARAGRFLGHTAIFAIVKPVRSPLALHDDPRSGYLNVYDGRVFADLDVDERSENHV